MSLKIITIRRFVPENMDAMYGIMLDEMKSPIAVTLEKPWKQNAPFISCISTGEYTCKRYSSEKYKNVWQICDVNGRDLVLIHWGNFLKDTQGCILVGEKFKDLNNDGIMDIADSRIFPNEGFLELMEMTKELTEFKLIIEQSHEWII